MIYFAWFIVSVIGPGLILQNFSGPAATTLAYAALITPPALAFLVVVHHRRSNP